jgi:hypothetical protein
MAATSDPVVATPANAARVCVLEGIRAVLLSAAVTPPAAASPPTRRMSQR